MGKMDNPPIDSKERRKTLSLFFNGILLQNVNKNVPIVICVTSHPIKMN